MNRRRFFAGAGGLLLSGVSARLLAAPVDPSTACHTTKAVTPGPFILPDSPLRSDIREGLPGIPLKLKFRVLDDIWCKPASDIIVDVWQCDAIGRYSGVENLNFDQETLRITGAGLDLRDQRFLRGHQITGEDGMVEFLTIIPGWYVPRLPHIHLTASWRGIPWTRFSTQLFFPEEVERFSWEAPPYAERGPNPISARRDIVVKGDQARLKALTLDLEKDGEGFAGTFELSMTSLA